MTNPRVLFLGAVPALLLVLILPDGEARSENVKSKDAAALIDALGADSAFARDEAYGELRRRGEEVRDALERAATAKDPRVRDAVTRLLESLEVGDDAGEEGLRLKDRLGSPKEDGNAMPTFPRVRPFPFPGGQEEDAWSKDLEEWNRQWNSDIEAWNREVDAWMKEMLGGTSPFTGGGFAPGGGTRGSFQTFRRDQDGTTEYELKVAPDGKVTAKITRDEDGERSEEKVEADSLEQFEAEYPEVARALGLGSDGLEGPGNGFAFRFAPPFGGRNLPLPSPVRPWVDEGSTLRPVSGPRLGVHVRVIEEGDPLRSHVALDPGIGLLVEDVVPSSLADELDVRRNDILVEVGGVPVGSPADVREGLEKSAAGALEVKVVREGTRRTLRRGV